MNRDILGNLLFVGDTCLYTYATTQVRYALVEVVEFKETGVICKVLKVNATTDEFRGIINGWKEGQITRPLAKTNLIKYEELG